MFETRKVFFVATSKPNSYITLYGFHVVSESWQDAMATAKLIMKEQYPDTEYRIITCKEKFEAYI